MKKYFIMMADLDSTFEEYDRSDKDRYVAAGQDQFGTFLEFVRAFEKKYNVQVAIHFVSGTSKQDFCDRVDYFKNNYPGIYNRLGFGVVETGKVVNKNHSQIDFCRTDGTPYSKADAVCKVLSDYMPFEIAGACFMGDSSIDVAGFRMLKEFNRFPLGTHTISPRSTRDYFIMNMDSDFYSNKPRILGCVEGLTKMAQAIDEKTHAIEADERSL